MTGNRSIIALSGGVGGAKLSLGLAQILAPGELSIVVNTADDFEHLGLPICPDVDTTLYTLGNIQNEQTGWGRRDETWSCMAALDELGAETWFQLGDRDIATHLYRKSLLDKGGTLSEVTQILAKAFGIDHEIVPMSDDPVRTIVVTDSGDLAFQEYFVKYQCKPTARSFRFDGIDTARPSPQFHHRLTRDNPVVVIICPSNPFVSVDPILDLPEIRKELSNLGKKVVAVSPIVGGQAIKGPAAKMMYELGMPVSALSVALHYREILSGFIVDEADEKEAAEITDQLGIPVLVCPTIMTTIESKIDLARKVLEFADRLAVEPGT